jgi:hypothetical protein
MSKHVATGVFTPSDFPTLTYVERGDARLEQRLRDALKTPGEIVSISGPSKSGKTVLIERVVGSDNLITVTGAGITNPEKLWDRILDWMDAPVSTGESKGSGTSMAARVGIEAEAGIFLVKGKAKGEGEVGAMRTQAKEEGRVRQGMTQVIKEIADSDYVILIDDFHYMNRGIQNEVAKQIKEAARQKLKICTASVPHRSDDVVRSNPELRGRVRAIDLAYWNVDELSRVAEIGFPLLKMDLKKEIVSKYALEASGSPQLMQAICLQTCFENQVSEELDEGRTFDLAAGTVKQILLETATRTDYSSLVRNMHAGPKSRGQERKIYKFKDGSKGDVYRAVLLAISSDPPRLSFNYKELSHRIESVCAEEAPQASSVNQVCLQIGKMADDMYPNQRVTEWSEEDYLLDIIDPYLLFYIRWSDKLRLLA